MFRKAPSPHQATRTDFEVVTPAGVTVFTSPDFDLAKAHSRRLPGLRVEIVETTITRRRAYAPRLQLVGAA